MSRKALMRNKEQSPSRHSEYLDGVDSDRLDSILWAVNRWNKGDKGDCGCGSCKLRIANNLVDDGNRLLGNLGNNGLFLAYNPTDQKIYWAMLEKPKVEVEDD